jgi:pimeloyl-ACP methyl ester carboxylesterase
MRIEVASPRIRVSGDIYVDDGTHGTPAKPLQPLTDAPLIIKKNWYPQLDMEEYAWYFRSLGVQYKHGVLTFKFERRLWDPLTSEFASGADTGWMKLVCGKAFNHPTLPQATIQMSGTAEIGGESYDLIARKTSPHYRGCRVEVDVMQNRSFPISAETCAGAALSFASIYRTAGWDCPAKISTSNIPDDSSLTTPELQAALTAFREPAVGPSWRLWLLVGSSQGGLFGLMFDDTEPHREGAVGFFDPTLPGDPIIEVSARNQKLGDVPAAFLRTLVHEAGHAFNLFHPKHDIHTVPIGTSIMNQTGDVMGFATEANPYPCNVTFAFDDHNRTSLIHSPDPQVAPGRKAFGWGHGDLFSGVAEPVDAGGLPRQPPQAPNLTLDLMMPDSVFRGEFVSARFVVTNTGKAPERVTTAINLSQGDLRLRVTAPGRPPADVRDRIIACGDREYQSLAPGESLEAVAQVFYTTAGRTFRQTGRYYVSAELHAGTSRFVHSQPIEVVVRAPQTPQEREISQIMMDEGVARSLALGDFGLDTSSRNKLQELVDRFGDTTTGAAAALVLANSLARPLRNIRTGKVIRKAEPEKSRQCLNIATRNRSATGVVDLAVAVVAPTDADAPVLKQVGGTGAARGKSKPKGKGKKAVGSAPASKRLAQLTRALVR